jgi:uncharacterized protein YggE
MYFSRRILLSPAIATLLTIPAQAADQPRITDVPQIMIVGYAHEWRVPDEASATAVMTGNGATADAAVEDLLASTTKSTTLVKQAGIAESDTVSSGPDIEPLYKHVFDAQGREIMERREPNGFRATFRLTFKTKNLEVLGKLIPALTGSKATINGVSFAISDYRDLQQSLEERAVADAVARARRQITAAGAKPGRILSIGEQPQSAPAPVFRAMAPAPMLAKSSPQSTDFSFALRPGKQDISAERPVVMEILPD